MITSRVLFKDGSYIDFVRETTQEELNNLFGNWARGGVIILKDDDSEVVRIYPWTNVSEVVCEEVSEDEV